MLEAQNANIQDGAWRGIFDLAPQQTFVLLIDHKTRGQDTFDELYTQLQPLRDLNFLTFWNGTQRVMRPLAIVVSGNAPFQSVTALNATHRDIFWHAKLESLVSADDSFTKPIRYAYNRSNSYFASTEFRNAVLYTYRNGSAPLPDTPRTKDMARTQLEQAKARGLLARYWNTPAQPSNLKEIVWRVLVELEVDILNMDDMGTVRARANGRSSVGVRKYPVEMAERLQD